MKLNLTKRFVKRYKKLDRQNQERIKHTMQQMEQDLSYPSLRVKKMKGYNHPVIWEASASMDLRITFEIEKPETLILRNCGHHDQTLNNP